MMEHRKGILALCFVLPLVLSAQQESVVNAFRDSTQRAPRIAQDSEGNAFVVWTSSHDTSDPHRSAIMGQWFDATGMPPGPEVYISALSTPRPSGRWRMHGSQSQPALAIDSQGMAAVAWTQFDSTTSGDVWLRMFDRLGVGTGPIPVVQKSWTQSRPAIAVSESGFVAVAWDSWDVSEAERGVYLRFFSRFGSPLGYDEIRVNARTEHSQARPAVSFISDTVVVVVWESWKQELAAPFEPTGDLASGYGVVARLMGPSGPLSQEVAVNSLTKDYQWQPDIVSFEDGSSFIVWCSWEQDGDDGSIVGRWFDADLAPVGPEIMINPTTRFYQWLPRVKKRGKDLTVVWSSWQQDGSREGVYGILLDSSGHRRSFETQLNSRTESFQWEPDAVVLPDGSIRAVWSDWGREGKDYEIVMADVMPVIPQGTLSPQSGVQAGGRSTSRYRVHVLDSTMLTGHIYEMRVTAADAGYARVDVIDTTAGQTRVSGYELNNGEGAFYRTPAFDGLSLEIIPEFDLTLLRIPEAVRSTSFPATWEVMLPTAGVMKLGPIDIAITFSGSGEVLDTAINISAQPVIQVPFRAWNLTDDEKVELLIVESTLQNTWDPGDRIVLRTPARYRSQVNNTHAEIRFAAGTTVDQMPGAGDTLLIRTTKPLAVDDVYRFTASVSALVGVEPGPMYPADIRLYQNYPNPFNPRTSIDFLLPAAANVSLTVHDVTGREVRRLLNGAPLPAGYRKVLWDGRTDSGAMVSTGAYFYVLEAEGIRRVGRMLLLK